jgi:hypothetical protein
MPVVFTSTQANLPLAVALAMQVLQARILHMATKVQHDQAMLSYTSEPSCNGPHPFADMV